ncbi:Restriction modification system DNA specificity domain [Lactobacillus delbrueckii subsp. bulgaricus]|nr:type I restriction modification DNA specificity domain protein [Lactobacillus delbrueckii subsp. bulgaricus]AXI15109.1 Restriction modification system DNA specificity domain [Lactobacillus delbrueckii subsp. bulgaricus]
MSNKQKYNPYFLLTESYHWSAKIKREAAAGTMQIVSKNEFSAIETFVP